MSIWTHVNGCIRVDGISGLPGCGSTRDVKEALGNTVDFDGSERAWDKCSVPCGSEGSLQYDIVVAGDGLVLWTIPIWGDLRDYDDAQGIEDWFYESLEQLGMIRSAILEIHVEGQEPIVLRAKDES